jgi:hypothetical protein
MTSRKIASERGHRKRVMHCVLLLSNIWKASFHTTVAVMLIAILMIVSGYKPSMQSLQDIVLWETHQTKIKFWRKQMRNMLKRDVLEATVCHFWQWPNDA